MRNYGNGFCVDCGVEIKRLSTTQRRCYKCQKLNLVESARRRKGTKEWRGYFREYMRKYHRETNRAKTFINLLSASSEIASKLTTKG